MLTSFCLVLDANCRRFRFETQTRTTNKAAASNLPTQTFANKNSRLLFTYVFLLFRCLVRKSIARVLTVINQTQKENLRRLFKVRLRTHCADHHCLLHLQISIFTRYVILADFFAVECSDHASPLSICPLFQTPRGY